MLEIKRKNELVNIFSSISELYNWCVDTPRRSNAKSSSETNDSYFCETSSLDESYEKMLYGDDKLYEDVIKEVKKFDITKILGNSIKRNKTFPDVVGFQPDVPNFLKGVPYDMINVQPKRVSQKIINLVYNISVNAGVNHRKIKNAGIVYAGILDILEKQGYRCNLYILSALEGCNEYGYCLVKVKTDREPFNLKKLCFLMASAGFDRRVIFKWIESCNLDEEVTHDGYGRPVTDKKRIKSVLEKELKQNFIIWNVCENFKVEIENVIKNLEESGIKIKED